MLQRFPVHVIFAGLTLLAVALCLPKIARADDADDLLAAVAEGAELQQKADYAGAAKAYERALELASRVAGPQDTNIAIILNGLAMQYYYLGQYAKAESLFQRSLKIHESNQNPNAAQSLSSLGALYCTMGQYAKAEPLYQRSIKMMESQLGPDHPDLATSLNNLAAMYLDMGQYDQAEPLYQRSLKIRESKLGPDHTDVAMSLNNLAELYRATSQYSYAEPLYQRSLKIWESEFGPEHPLVATSLSNLALLEQAIGRYAQAESLFQRSLKIRDSKLGPDHPDVAMSLNNLALLYWDMGQYVPAEPLLVRSLRIMESQFGADHPGLATSLNNLAALYDRMGQSAKVEPLLQRSLRIRESKLGPDHPDVAASLNCMADRYQGLGQSAQAEPLYQRSLKIRESKLGPDHPDVAISLNSLAILYHDRGQSARAEPLLKRSLKIRESKLGADHPDLATSLNNLMRLLAATERWPEAVAEAEKARRIVRRHVAHTLPILSEKEQLTFLQNKDEEHLHTALSLGLHQRDEGPSALRSAGWILNGKAVAQEVLAQRAILANAGSDPALAELVKQLLDVRRRLASLSLAIPTQGQEAAHHEQLNALTQQEQDLSRQLGQTTSQTTAADPWVEPEAVRKALAKDALLIDIARFGISDFKAQGKKPHGPPHYVAWLIPAEGQGDIRVVDLGDAKPIDEAVHQARKALEKAEATIREVGEAKAEKQLREALRSLTQLVYEPLEAHFGNARQLVLSPDAALWLVPWGALPLSDGKYAIEKYRIRYCISGRDLVSAATTKDPTLNPPVLFANPDYDLGPTELEERTRAVLRSTATVEPLTSSRGRGSLGSLPRVGRLPGTAAEAAAIKPNVTRYAGTEPAVYEDQYALEGVFKAVHSPRVLVLSTHGFFLADQEVASSDKERGFSTDDIGKSRAALTTEGKPLENPLLRCGLLLAGCNQRAEDATAGIDDGVLTGMEIVGTDLRGTELVVLSACETGLGQVRNGEGVAGLRQAFQLAGAKAVVSTLWQIPDEETAELMNTFFANLSTGGSKADALRSAQLAQIKARREDKSAAHPYYWAAFTLTGE